MSKAIIVPWHNYAEEDKTDYHKIFYDYFVQQFPLWQDIVDTVYMINTNWNFTDEDKKKLTDIKKDVIFLKKEGFIHNYFQDVLDVIKEDEIFLMDCDCFIYNRNGIQTWFDTLGDHDCVVTLSEGNSLREVVFEKYPYLKQRGTPGIWMNHILLTRKLLGKLQTLDFSKEKPYILFDFEEGTYIPELDYTTKKGDWGEVFCRLIWQIFQHDWVEMPFLPNQGFKHFHDQHHAYQLLSWRKKNRDYYTKFLQGHSSDVEKYTTILSWYLMIDTEGKYAKETKEVLFDFLKMGIKTS